MKYLRKTYYILSFIGFYVLSLLKANLHLAWDIITPKDLHTPDIITVKLDIKQESGLLLFCNLVSMTPGTLVIDLKKETQEAVVHILYSDKELKTRKDLAMIESRIKKIMET